MRATPRRTLRTAVIATGLIAGIAAMPTATAFAATEPTPQTQNQDQVTPDDQDQEDQATPQDQEDQQPAPDNGSPAVGGWVSKGTVALGNGWVAEVDVNASARSAKARIFLYGKAKGSLTAQQRSATTRIHGCTFTLTSDGRITKTGKRDGGDRNRNGKRAHVRTYKNLGGSGFDAKVFKVRSGYDAEMWGKDPASGAYTKWDTLRQRGDRAAYGQHNGAHFVLGPDGRMKAWTEGGKAGAVAAKAAHDRIAPAGAEVPGDGGSSAPLLAAGGGMAAAGAAGLSFAMLRRGREDG
ncbi:hypothetical protein [Streptomyces sp. Da 82-17]|uniref:hypothetical protein n=1 Tax=Streptomyces sp. Da 82-17 TaxID=3377116 RepID=UPI0038D4BE46